MIPSLKYSLCSEKINIFTLYLNEPKGSVLYVYKCKIRQYGTLFYYNDFKV